MSAYSWFMIGIGSLKLLTFTAAWPYAAVLTWIKAWWRIVSSNLILISSLNRALHKVTLLTWWSWSRALSLKPLIQVRALNHVISFSFYPIHYIDRETWYCSNWWCLFITDESTYSHSAHRCGFAKVLLIEVWSDFFLLRELYWWQFTVCPSLIALTLG